VVQIPDPDQADGLFVVTGANSGLGFEVARKLAAASPRNELILGCRDINKGRAASREIERATGNARLRVIALDLASINSVREFAAQVHGPIAALVCNAGIARGDAETVDGLDGVFETNHLGHYLLTLSLLNELAPDGRIVVVSSDMHHPPGPALKWPGAEALAEPNRSRSAAVHRYSFSKLCNLYFVYELARRLHANGSGISVAAFNPGLMTETNFATMSPLLGAVMRRVFASRKGELGASSAALAALAGRGNPLTFDGEYFDRTAAAPGRSSALSHSAENAADLWRVSARLTGADL
jgi:NAD(P)-dependent dehydrogenase (short-subunit alcohol dehydrogenase family)